MVSIEEDKEKWVYKYLSRYYNKPWLSDQWSAVNTPNKHIGHCRSLILIKDSL